MGGGRRGREGNLLGVSVSLLGGDFLSPMLRALSFSWSVGVVLLLLLLGELLLSSASLYGAKLIRLVSVSFSSHVVLLPGQEAGTTKIRELDLVNVFGLGNAGGDYLHVGGEFDEDDE